MIGNYPQVAHITGETRNGRDDQPLDVRGQEKARKTPWDSETVEIRRKQAVWELFCRGEGLEVHMPVSPASGGRHLACAGLN